MLLTTVLVLFLVAAAFGAGFAIATQPRPPWITHAANVVRRALSSSSSPPPILEPASPEPVEGAITTTITTTTPTTPEPIEQISTVAPSIVRFEPGVPRGTASTDLTLHREEWRAEMRAIGQRLSAADVFAVVFVHGTFTGSDPFSAYGVVERSFPRIGPELARRLRKKTRSYVERVLGDLGNFGAPYVRLFEDAIDEREEARTPIPCTDFIWSSENHHVGRLEGALGLVRVLATHAELAPHAVANRKNQRRRRILVIGHSHAGQLFALVTQLFARSMAHEAILDVARARSLDVAALETDLMTMEDCAVDFVTFGSPARYAWASVAGVRALHVIGVGPDGAPDAISGDWIRRLGVDGSDFPPLRNEERRINATLADSLGSLSPNSSFAPSRIAAALRAGAGLPSNGDITFVDYGAKGLSSVMSTGLGHGMYTRLDGMLFHMQLIADRLYPSASAASADAITGSTASQLRRALRSSHQ